MPKSTKKCQRVLKSAKTLKFAKNLQKIAKSVKKCEKR